MAIAGRSRGRLFDFRGDAPGAGKTFAMLGEGARLAEAGMDVVVALDETHRWDLSEGGSLVLSNELGLSWP